MISRHIRAVRIIPHERRNQTPQREQEQREETRRPKRRMPAILPDERHENHRRDRRPPLPCRAPTAKEKRCAGEEDDEQREDEDLALKDRKRGCGATSESQNRVLRSTFCRLCI